MNYARNYAKLMVIVGLVAVTANMASALDLKGYVGPVKMKYTNYDVGVMYYPGQNGEWIGQSTLDALPQSPVPGGAPGEDLWFIFRMENITDLTGTIVLWDRTSAAEEITGIGWGEYDTYLRVTNHGLPTESDEIHGRSLYVAFFEDTSKNFDPYGQGNPAPVARGTPNPTYPTATDGNLLWTLASVPGWNMNFPDDEFFTTFYPQAGGPGGTTAQGGFFAEAGPVPYWGTGPFNWWLSDPNGADVKADFSGDIDPRQEWHIISDDPMRTRLNIPEPGTTAFLLLGLAGLGALRYRRRTH